MTTAADARMCVEAGATAIGINFWSGSPRFCELEAARAIRSAVPSSLRVVGVVVDATDAEIAAIRGFGVEWIQLHGSETAERLAELAPFAYRAVHVASDADLKRALGVGGTEVLVDARSKSLPGGTGMTCDWTYAAKLAARRTVWLAGGLTPSNVQAAIRAVAPYGVDVASGVESSPGKKDPALVHAFVAAARDSG